MPGALGAADTTPRRSGLRVARSRSRNTDRTRYSTPTLPDHLVDLIAPMATSVSAADATKTLRVGTMVLNNDLHHPVLLAREAAMLDIMTDGRLQLGSRGGKQTMHLELPAEVLRG